MSHQERQFRADGSGPLTLAELAALLADTKVSAEHDRNEAIACYLSAGEGWTDAARRLGGAFAAPGLKDRKID